MVTAKVICNSKKLSGTGEERQVEVYFIADYNDARNKEWSRWTPALSLAMTLKGDVSEQFDIGQAYTLQFVKED